MGSPILQKQKKQAEAVNKQKGFLRVSPFFELIKLIRDRIN